jgi:hypothetical protein
VSETRTIEIAVLTDTTPPNISVQYPDEVADWRQFQIEANITGPGLQNVTFLQNSAPISYSVSNDTYTSLCLGPFPAGTSLNYTLGALDKDNNTAFKEFSIGVVEGEVKIKAKGRLKEEDRKVKLELEAGWKKGKAKGEFQLKEEVWVKEEEGDSEDEGEREEKKRFRAHGKIDILYKDCNGVFTMSGLAKVESGEGRGKIKEKDVSFTGSMVEDEIKIVIDGREFLVPAAVKIKREQ